MASTERTDEPLRPLRFGAGGRFDLRPAEYRLLVDGEPAALGARALDLLLALAARPGQLLTKKELLAIVWPGLVVEENNLRVQVNTLRRLLGEDAISTVPGRGYRLSVVMHEQAEPALPSPAPVETRAQAPRLIGRSADLARLESLLRAAGACVMLVGTPGVGKSSLARAALARWAARSAWVDLAPLTQGAQVTGAIARALGAQLDEGDPAPQLLRAIGHEPFLLVLDNAEHLIEACADWATRLAGAPTLRLLVTSQLPLGVSAERVQRLDPLQVIEAAGTPDVREGALALLAERISATDSRYEITPEALPLMAALCRQLDGLPLALEMAAARVPLMGLEAVNNALAERFALLSRGRRDSAARHRTLHDALDWSYQLLSSSEQRLFRALGVFAGGFTPDLAVSLAAEEGVGRWDVVDGLATLVERSLVSVNGEDPPRYRLLETMRAFALEQMSSAAAAQERESLRRRHAAAVLALFTDSQSDAQCLAEMENAREAFMWAREHDLPTAAQLSSRVVLVIGFTIWRQDVTDWMLSLQALMLDAQGQALPPAVQAEWWSLLAYVLNVRRDAAARPAAKRAVALWRPLSNPTRLMAALAHWVRSIREPGAELDAACAELKQVAAELPSPADQVRAQGALAEAARVRDDIEALLACREQELQLSGELGWADMAQAAQCNVCAALIELGRHAEAAVRAHALLEQVDADGGDSNGNLPWALNVRVEALTALGRLEQARALVPRSLAAGHRFGTTVAWQGILGLVLAQQRPRTVARLAGHVRQLWATRGATPDRDELRRLEHCTTAAQAQLGTELVALLMAEGRLLGDEQAAALAARDVDEALARSGHADDVPGK